MRGCNKFLSLKWFGHNEKRCETVRKVLSIETAGPRLVAWLGKLQKKDIEEDLDGLGIHADSAQDRRKYR